MTQEIGNRKTYLTSFHDKTQEYKAENCVLNVLLSSTRLSYVLFNPNSLSVHLLAYYDFEKITDEVIQTIKNDTFIANRHIKTHCFYFAPLYSLIPNELQEDLSRMNEIVWSAQATESYALKNKAIQLLSSVPPDLKKMLESCLNARDCKHISAPFLDQLIKENTQSENRVFVNFIQSHIEIIAFSKGKLQLCNCYPVKTAEDAIYFIVSVYESLSFNTEIVPLVMGGDVHADSKIYNLIDRYIGNIEWMKRSERYKYDAALQELPNNYFINQFTSLECE